MSTTLTLHQRLATCFSICFDFSAFVVHEAFHCVVFNGLEFNFEGYRWISMVALSLLSLCFFFLNFLLFLIDWVNYPWPWWLVFKLLLVWWISGDCSDYVVTLKVLRFWDFTICLFEILIFGIVYRIWYDTWLFLSTGLVIKPVPHMWHSKMHMLKKLHAWSVGVFI